MTTLRLATVKTAVSRLDTVRRLLPMNYTANWVAEDTDEQCILIAGTDEAGWTMDDYVIPRLASALIFARELQVQPKDPS